MKTIKNTIIFLAVTFLFSCTEPFNPPLSETYTRLFVEGYINTDTTAHEVILSYSTKIYDTISPEMVSNAIVSITNGTDTFNLTENIEKPGHYFTEPNVYGISDRIYTLKIENIDINKDGEQDTVWASSYLPDAGTFDSIALEYDNTRRREGWRINCYAQDQKNVENYYMFDARINGELYSDTIGVKTYSDDQIFDGSYTNGITLYTILNEWPENDQAFPGDLYKQGGLQDGDTITVEISATTKDFFKFLDQATTQSFGYNPMFGGPPASVISNIEPSDIAVGVFSAYATQRSSTIFKKPVTKK
jgi:hypothetical protein